MNSIMQEASSLAKAVEQAWIKAGKPQKFSIRVFEEAQKNFIGMTVNPAKIALLFEKKDILYKEEREAKKRTIKPQEQLTRRQPRREATSKSKPAQKEQATETIKQKILWSDEMVAIARNWMHSALDKMGKKGVTFTTEAKRYHLRFVLDGVLSDSEEKQKDIFRNFAYLIMQTVRNRQKKQFKYHKVVLTSET